MSPMVVMAAGTVRNHETFRRPGGPRCRRALPSDRGWNAKQPLTCAFGGSGAARAGGRYWVRTSDLFGVNEARYHCANRPHLRTAGVPAVRSQTLAYGPRRFTFREPRHDPDGPPSPPQTRPPTAGQDEERP